MSRGRALCWSTERALAMSREDALREEIARHAARLRWIASRGEFDGRVDGLAGIANRAYLDRCRLVHQPTATVAILSRDAGHHSSGWMRNPDYERCWHLSLSPAPEWTMRAEAPRLAASQGIGILRVAPGIQVAWHDAWTRRMWVDAAFGEAARLAWVEPSATCGGRRAEVQHWRVFCDESWAPILPRGEVYSSELTERGWRSASQVWEEGAARGPVVREG